MIFRVLEISIFITAIPSWLHKEQKLLRTNECIEESNGSVLPKSTSPDSSIH